MPQESFAARYRAAERLAGGRCPIEAGLICRLADHDAATDASRSTAPTLRLLARGRRRRVPTGRDARPAEARAGRSGRGVVASRLIAALLCRRKDCRRRPAEQRSDALRSQQRGEQCRASGR